MSSAVKLILGVCTLSAAATFAGCDSGGSDTPGSAGVMTFAGMGNTSAGAPAAQGGGTSPTAGGSSGGADASGVPLIPAMGWVDGKSNSLGIQGAVISYADDVSKAGPPAMTTDVTGTNACISGLAALVDTASPACTNKMFTAPATDCYGQYWGAAIALNLNQPNDTTVTPPMAGMAAAFDGSQLAGFSFDIAGDTVPGPKDIRFNVENVAGTQFCNIPTHKVVTGTNTFMFTDLVKACYKITTDPPNETITPAVQTSLLKISWQIVTNTSSTVPFNFCISNIRAILKPGAVVGGGAGAPGVAGSSGVAGSPGASGSTSAGGSSAGGTSAGGSSAGGSSAGSSSGGTSSGGSSGAGTAGTGG